MRGIYQYEEAVEENAAYHNENTVEAHHLQPDTFDGQRFSTLFEIEIVRFHFRFTFATYGRRFLLEERI